MKVSHLVCSMRVAIFWLTISQLKIAVTVVNKLSHHDTLTRVFSESFTKPVKTIVYKGIVLSSSTMSLTLTGYTVVTLSTRNRCLIVM